MRVKHARGFARFPAISYILEGRIEWRRKKLAVNERDEERKGKRERERERESTG